MKFTKTALATMGLFTTTSVRGFAFVSNRAGSRLMLAQQQQQSQRAVLAAATPFSRFQSSSTAMSMMMSGNSVEDFVKTEIDSNKVVVFSKSTCPFCMATKELLDDMDVDYKAIELNKIDDGADVQMALADLSGQRTVPNVFINGQHVGGNDDTQAAAQSGKLQEMLAN